jgi:hypothetical protein
MIKGKFRGLEFSIWESEGYFRWSWSVFGNGSTTLGDCYAGIRRAASEWSKQNGVWGFSQEPL